MELPARAPLTYIASHAPHVDRRLSESQDRSPTTRPDDATGQAWPGIIMKSARIHAFTDRPEDICIEDVPVPQPGPGQVRVRMLLSPVNPSDFHYVCGTYYRSLERVVWNQGLTPADPRICFDPDRRIECPAPPYALGGEGVGIVDACGSGFLAGRLKGKRVAVGGTPPNGTWQEFTVVQWRRALPVPAGMSNEQAAMYLVNPVSAYVMVREVLDVPKGGWLLLTAAGSALGKSVVRLGRRDGFRTLCVVRSRANAAELKALGADAVIETDTQDLITEVARLTAGQGVGSALDCVGGELTGKVARCLGLGGHLVVYGTLMDRPMEIPPRDLMMPSTHITGFYLGNWMATQSPLKLLGVLRAVKKLTLEGIFHTEVAEIFSLDEAARAVSASRAPGRAGKVMLRIAAS
jgi:NADPH:quinone reductase-like Zn-dependent oxidoreductase